MWRDFGHEINNKDLILPEYFPRLLEEWCALVGRYCQVTNGVDTPYDHNERANVGLLSAAAWRVGLIALEEFPSQKRKEKDAGDGRCDLWIRSAGAEEGAPFEAKYAQVGPENARAEAENLLKKACEDAKNLSDEWFVERQRYGLAFCSLSVQITEKTDVERCIASVLKELSSLDLAAIAWAFPPIMRKPQTNDNWYRPGVFLMIRVQEYTAEN
jgi:hypothetical protein